MRLRLALCRRKSHKKGAVRPRDTPYTAPMRAGYSLSELMLVLAVVGLLLGIAVPRLSRAMDYVEVEAAANELVAAHQRARMMAIVRGQVLTLDVDSAQLRITLPSGTIPLWVQQGPAASGVRLSGPTRRFTFSPTGITLGLSNASLLLTRGASVRTVVFSRLGRVRVLR
jgi:prepilin-type N-terminal cleavage/methylation domain-containing protein